MNADTLTPDRGKQYAGQDARVVWKDSVSGDQRPFQSINEKKKKNS
jgi:hypothetical protein